MPQTLAAGEKLPNLTWPLVGGGLLDLAEQSGWRMLVVYRGKHCPMCKRYLSGLGELLGDYRNAGVVVAALSADTREKAEEDVAEFGWQFPVGYGLVPEEMRQLGLYVSHPRSAQETDRQFAEPGLFVLNPAGHLHIIATSNAPSARPDLGVLLNGINFIAKNGAPIRGTA